MLEINGLRSGYSTNDILQAVDLVVAPGSVTALIGSNGAGKTTLLRTVSGLLKPRNGEIRLLNENINGKSPAEIVKRGIAQVPEGRELFPRMSVHDNLMLGAYLRTGAQIKRDLDKVYTYFPVLKAKAKHNARNLSGGEQQMVAFGRALMAGPKYLLLDEPSVGLAPLIEQKLIATVQDLARDEGLGVLLVEQNATLALTVSEKAYVIELGRIAKSGSASDLLNDGSIRKAYLGL
jgi:branched-chain amino acid transport system ATP-binding protein